MRERTVFTRVILTIIAGFLGWSTVARYRIPAVHAQSTEMRYGVELISADITTEHYRADLESAINNAAKGRQLLTLTALDQPGRYIAVYKQESH